MTKLPSTHKWVCGGRRSDRRAAIATLALPVEIVPSVDAHRRLRGPYTAAGTLARAVVPALVRERPDLLRQHDIELLSVAPELSDVLPNSRETLTSMAIPAERTRFYARLRTRRIANGLVELFRDSLPEDQPRALVVENVEHAEQTDLEFLAALIRRVDPDRLTVVICSGTDELPVGDLSSVLESRAERVVVRADPVYSALGEGDDLGWAYIATDGTSDDRRLHRAYEQLAPSERARLHDRRAEDLAHLDQQSLRLGAIPYHLERGTDPRGAGAKALYSAQDYCVCLGFYEAVVDYGYRGIELIERNDQEDLWWMFTIELTLALSVLSRTKEAERLYDQARLLSTKPSVHMAAAYSTAMLYTRHNDPEDRDEKKAKAWLNSAIATASLVADPSERAFQSAFYRNGLALVEVDLGEPSEALRLVNECIASLDRDLAPHEHRLHRSVLKNNRARVFASLGRIDAALADYEVVISEDPNHAEHYLERGNLLRRVGRSEEALADYETALRLSPPFPEIYYNRGDLRATVGDAPGALADFGYVLELDPDFVDAYVNRAGLRLDAGDLEGAWCDATAGLQRDPENPYLHAVIGQIYATREEYPEARASFDRAVQSDPDMISALSGRAAVSFDLGEVDAAITDLQRAMELDPDDPGLLFNRAFAYQRCGRFDEALADLETAARLAPDDTDITAALAECQQALILH